MKRKTLKKRRGGSTDKEKGIREYLEKLQETFDYLEKENNKLSDAGDLKLDEITGLKNYILQKLDEAGKIKQRYNLSRHTDYSNPNMRDAEYLDSLIREALIELNQRQEELPMQQNGSKRRKTKKSRK